MDNNSFMEHYLHNSPVVFFRWRNDSDYTIEYVTPNVEKMLGYTQQELLGSAYREFIEPDDIAKIASEIAEQSNGDTIRLTPYKIKTKNGSIFWVSDDTKVIRDSDGNIIHFDGYLSDVSEHNITKEALQESLRQLQKLGKQASVYFDTLDKYYILSMSDKSGRITYVNDNLAEFTGYSKEEMLGKPHNILRHPEVPKEIFKELWDTILDKKVWSGRLKNLKKDGTPYYVQAIIRPILNINNEIEQFIAIRYDITDYIKQQEHIEAMALTSAMTKLPNLYALVRDIELVESPSLAVVNIDGFKVLNNLYGYKTGDNIIKYIADKLKKNLECSDASIYHIHADEFGVLCKNCNLDSFFQKMRDFQERVHKIGYLLDDKYIPIRISISISDEPKDRLLSSANMAMHYARTNNEKLVRYGAMVDFSKNYDDNIKWTTMLQDAIADDMIVPFFQPIFDIKNNKIEKFESLVRLKKDGEVYSPFFFLDIAKKVKLYPEISLIMLEKTFEYIKEHPYEFSINLTVDDILDANYTAKLFELLEQERKGSIILEIVESEGIENFDTVNEFVESAKKLGCKIAIDDFGTGYSNFEYLLKLNADFIKIDGSLIKNIDINDDSYDIVETIVSFAKKKNIAVVAEFVSNEKIYHTIESLGIEYAQGFLIAKPEECLQLEFDKAQIANCPLSSIGS